MRDYALDTLAAEDVDFPSDAGRISWGRHNRPNTHGTSAIAVETLKTFIESRNGPATLNEVSSTKHAVAALYVMKGMEFVQEHRGDESAIQILRSLPLAYQIDVLVKKFKDGAYEYPSPDVILSIMSDMEDEGMFGPCDSLA